MKNRTGANTATQASCSVTAWPSTSSPTTRACPPSTCPAGRGAAGSGGGARHPAWRIGNRNRKRSPAGGFRKKSQGRREEEGRTETNREQVRKNVYESRRFFNFTVGAQSIAHVRQNLVNCRGNISAHRRRRKLRFFLFERSSAREWIKILTDVKIL